MLLLPKMTVIGDGAFLADDTMIASYEMRGGWLRIEPASVGRRAFLGNSGIAGPGRAVPKNGLVAVLSSTPAKAKKGSSWLGSPPVRLRRSPDAADRTRTFNPPMRLKLARAAVELCRVVPLVCSGAIAVGVLLTFQLLAANYGYGPASALGGLVLLAAGAVACGLAVVAKWLLVGRIRPVEHPLWSSFVWRNEVSDTFVEMVAAPWFARAATGTAVLNLWLRALGARIGRGVWCESYWLPEADLVTLEDGCDGEPGLRGANPPVPRSDHADGHSRSRCRLDARPALRHPARRRARAGVDRRPGVAGHARRTGAWKHPLGRKPDRAGIRRIGVSRERGRRGRSTRMCPAAATADIAPDTMTSPSATGPGRTGSTRRLSSTSSPATRCRGSRSI